MIKTPEDAVPHWDDRGGRQDQIFLASEAAQIARAYSHAQYIHEMADARATHLANLHQWMSRKWCRYDNLAARAQAQAEAWEKLFAEWLM